MHEFSLAQGLHDQILDCLHANQMSKVLKAEIAIGSDAGIVVESFLFGFDVLAKQHLATKDIDLFVSHNESADLMLMRLELE